MKNVYLIRKKETGQYLNQKGKWSTSITSYRLKEFETEEEAKASIPDGVVCVITRKNKKNSDEQEDSVKSLKFNYYLEDLFSKCYLNSNNEFKVWAAIMPEAVSFDSEDAALDKAEELNLDLDKIRVIRLLASTSDKK